MPTIEHLSPGVTFTWAREPSRNRGRRRRTTARSGSVTVRREPVVSPAPSEEQLAAVREAMSREQIAALLAGTAAPGTRRGDVDTRTMAQRLVGAGVARETVLLALLDAGQSDVGALRAVWGGSVADVRRLVRVLLHHAQWSGERLLHTFSAVGVTAPERAALFEVVSGPDDTQPWCSRIRCGPRCVACRACSPADTSGDPADHSGR